MDLLCVDDDPGFLDLTATALRERLPGATVHTATQIRDAEGVLNAEPLDCIVCEYEMPDRTGLEFLKSVRIDHSDLPFILFTGEGSEAIASRAISAGVTDYLRKRDTGEHDLLVERIRHAVTEYQTKRDLQERVKELTAIRSISDLLSSEDEGTATPLQQVVTYCSQSLQYPDHAVVRLIVDGAEFASQERDTADRDVETPGLTVQTVTLNGKEVTLSAEYVSGPPIETDGDPFLSEERELLDTVLQLVTAYLDRHRVLADLHEEQRRLRLILENTTAAMYLKDTEGRYVFVNGEYERLFDRPSEAIVGRTDAEIHSVEMADSVMENDRRVLESEESIRVEERISVDGADRFYLSLKVPARTAGGDIEGVFGVSTDITEQRTRERQLEELNRAISRLLSANTTEEVAEFGVEAARDILDLRANAIHLYDDETAELVPVAYTDPVEELIGRPPTFSGPGSIAWRVFSEGSATAIDDVHADPDRYDPETPIRSELYLPLGEYGILLAGSTTPAEFDQQDVTVGKLLASHIVVALDVLTYEQQLHDREAELKQQNERLDQFSSMISHDLKNPLSIAVGYLDRYRETGDASELERVERSLDRVQELITDLTALSRYGETGDSYEPVSLAAVSRDAWETMETCSATLSTTDRTIAADRSQLQALLENLFRNAVGHGGPEVSVRVGPLEDGFYVEDTGEGIAEEIREKVFEHGFTTGYGGSGIGLTIVSRIAQSHGWAVSLDESPEGGARFEFREETEET